MRAFEATAEKSIPLVFMSQYSFNAEKKPCSMRECYTMPIVMQEYFVILCIVCQCSTFMNESQPVTAECFILNSFSSGYWLTEFFLYNCHHINVNASFKNNKIGDITDRMISFNFPQFPFKTPSGVVMHCILNQGKLTSTHVEIVISA